MQDYPSGISYLNSRRISRIEHLTSVENVGEGLGNNAADEKVYRDLRNVNDWVEVMNQNMQASQNHWSCAYECLGNDVRYLYGKCVI